jgi:hypothetical protein
MPLFAATVWDEALARDLNVATGASLFRGRELADPGAASVALGALRLWNDDFEAAHSLAQGIENANGSYLHGLCHRREGHAGSGLESNLGNARHWFRRVGQHPAFDPVYRMALNELGNAGHGFRWATEARAQLERAGAWDPFAMIDWFSEAERGTLSGQSRALLEEIQWREIDLFADWAAQRALGE